MKRFLEFFQQQDGGYCVLQLIIAIIFAIFTVNWTIVTIDKMQLAEVPTNLGVLLAALLAAKVWKDKVDNSAPPAQSTTITPTTTQTS